MKKIFILITLTLTFLFSVTGYAMEEHNIDIREHGMSDSMNYAKYFLDFLEHINKSKSDKKDKINSENFFDFLIKAKEENEKVEADLINFDNNEDSDQGNEELINLIVPSEVATRESFVILVNDAFNFRQAVGLGFGDVDDSEISHEFLIAKTAGYMKGYPNYDNDSFYDAMVHPNKKVSRAEAAVMISRILGELPSDENIDIADVDDIPEWAVNDVRNIVNSGYMTTFDDGKFNPNDNLLNEHLSILLERIKTDTNLHLPVKERLDVVSFDGYKIDTQIIYPSNKNEIENIVIYCDGSNPSTFDNRFYLLNYMDFSFTDMLAEGIVDENTALLTYSDRGVDYVEEEFEDYVIDLDDYNDYRPSIHVKDVEKLYQHIKKDDRFKNANIYMLGFSEGTSTITNALAERNIKVDGVVLSGYFGNSLKEVLKFQMTEAPYYMLTMMLDIPFADEITREYYESYEDGFLTFIFGDYDEFDINNDGILNVKDFRLMLNDIYNDTIKIINAGADTYVYDAFGHYSDWFKDHFKVKNLDNLLKVNAPIHIVQGEYDINTPVTELYDAVKAFENKRKKNLTYEVIPGVQHDLNLDEYLIFGDAPEGFEKIFEAVKEMQANDAN